MGRDFLGKSLCDLCSLCLNFGNWLLQTCCLLILCSVISETLQKITVPHILFRSLQWVILAIPQRVDIHQQPQVSCLDEVNIKWQWWSFLEWKGGMDEEQDCRGFSWLTEAFCALLLGPIFILAGDSDLYNMGALPCARVTSIFIHLKWSTQH